MSTDSGNDSGSDIPAPGEKVNVGGKFLVPTEHVYTVCLKGATDSGDYESLAVVASFDSGYEYAERHVKTLRRVRWSHGKRRVRQVDNGPVEFTSPWYTRDPEGAQVLCMVRDTNDDLEYIVCKVPFYRR